MPNGDRALDFEAILKTTDFKKELGDLERRITGFASKAVSETKKIDDTYSKLTKAASGIFAANQLSQLPGQIIKVRGEYQNLEIALTTILKSKSAADKVLADGAKLAATTPFTFTEVGQGIKQLLAYGSTASSVVDEVRMLGDVAAGATVPINDLIYLYGTLRTQGRAYTVDIRQFAGRGIPIYAELAKVLKVNVDEVNNFVEAGKVGFKEVEQVFKNLTSSGGQFEGLTQKTSKSLTGLLSNLQDAYERMFNKIGQSQEGLLASGILTATELVNNYEKIIDVLKVVVATYGTYRAALLVTTALQSSSAIGSSISIWFSLATSIKSAADAQALFNLTTKANPYAILVAGIAALVAYLYVYSDETKKLVTASELLVDANKGVAASVRLQQTEITTLVSQIKNQNLAESVRLEAYEKLKSISPDIVKNLSFEQSKTADLTKEVSNYTLALERSLKMEALRGKLKIAVEQQIAAEEAKVLAEKELKGTSRISNGLAGVNGATTGFNTKIGGFSNLDIATAKVKDAQIALLQSTKVFNDILNAQEKVLTKSTTEQTKERIKNLELLRDSYGKLTPEFKKYEDQINSLNKQLSDKAPVVAKSFSQKLAEANDVGNLLLLKSQAKTENEIEALSKKIDEKKKDLDKSSGDYKRLQKAYEQLNPKKSDKKPEEVFPFGSLKYWDEVAKKAQEVIEKTPSTNTAVIQKQQEIRLNAEQQAEKIRQSLVKRSFDEELEYKRQQYELYNSWVVYQGKAAADGQFSELVKSGASYREFLQNEISMLEGKLTAGTATPQDQTNLVRAKVALDIDNESFDKYKNRIIDTIEEVETLTEKLRILKNEQGKLGAGNVDEAKFISEEVIAIEKKRQQLLKQFIIDNNVSGEQELQIQSYYSDLRVQLTEEEKKGKIKNYQEALDKINKEEKIALAERAADEVKRTSETYKEIENIVQASTIRTLKIQKEAIEAKLQALRIAGANESEEYKQQERALILINKGIEKATLDSYSELANIFGQIGQELQGLGGDLATIGASLADAASKTSSVFNVIEKYNNAKAEKDEKQRKALMADAKQASQMMLLQTAINGVIDAINNIGSAYNRNKDLQNQYYNTVKSQQIEYNKLLNDEIRLKSQNSGNPFLKDYAAIFGNSVLAKADALKKFNEQLAILQDSGKAKDGTKVSVDFLQIISGFLSNPIGNFGKGIGTKDALTPILSKYPELIDKSKQGVESFNMALAKSLIATNAVDEATKEQLQSVIDWAGKYEEAQKQLQSTLVELVGQIGNDLQNAFEEAFRTGSDSAQAFGKVVGDVMGRIARQMVFESLMKPLIDQFSKDIAASYDVLNGGDGTIADDLDRLGKGSAIIAPKLEEAYKAIDKMLVETGYGNSAIGGTGSSSSNSLSGAVKGITEETAGLIAGQFNALRITSASTLQVNRDQLLALTNISNNSNFLKKLDLLESIDRKLGNNDLRAGGVG